MIRKGKENNLPSGLPELIHVGQRSVTEIISADPVSSSGPGVFSWDVEVGCERNVKSWITGRPSRQVVPDNLHLRRVRPDSGV